MIVTLLERDSRWFCVHLVYEQHAGLGRLQHEYLTSKLGMKKNIFISPS